jgi:hypothetical protein
MIGLVTGQRVRVKRTGKLGVVTALGRREDEDGFYTAALVLLDPFVARWSGAAPSCVTTLEGVYAIEDLEEAPPDAVFSYPIG